MKHIEDLCARYPKLASCRGDIERAAKTIIASFESGGKLLVAGNGGSAADASHIVAELMKGFAKKRPVQRELIDCIKRINAGAGSYLANKLQGALPVIALGDNTPLVTACINDIGGEVIFAQAVNGYGKKGDCFLAISTSGTSKNIVYAAALAKALGLATIALTGGSGGRLKNIADIAIIVPQLETYKVQELHIPVYHALCLEIEEHFWKN